MALHTDAGAQSVAASDQLLVSGWSSGAIHAHSLGGGPVGQGVPLWSIPGAHATAHASGVPALQISQHGRFIASGGAGGELRVWDVASREMASHLKHHGAAITDLKVCSSRRSLWAVP